jgi:hypothetical protein
LQLQPWPPIVPASIAHGAPRAVRHDIADAPWPRVLRPAGTAASLTPPAHATDSAFDRIDRTINRAGGTGFVIHQLLAAQPDLRGPPPDMPRTIAAYRAHLALRIHYSGPVGPVDLRV